MQSGISRLPKQDLCLGGGLWICCCQLVAWLILPAGARLPGESPQHPQPWKMEGAFLFWLWGEEKSEYLSAQQSEVQAIPQREQIKFSWDAGDNIV